jgi:hypothetical protein
MLPARRPIPKGLNAFSYLSKSLFENNLFYNLFEFENSFRDDYFAAVIANRKGAPLTQALVPSKHPTADERVPATG